jgi:hypothetical protein
MKSESKMQIQTGTARLDTSKISRIEIINHAGTSQFIKFGRAFTAYKELGDFNQLTISLQDGGQTIKIFLD